jgi:hypothetical protein
MNEQPEQPDQPALDTQDGDLQFLNAELDKLIQQEKERQSQVGSATQDHLGEPRLAKMELSHNEIHAIDTGVKMTFQFCSMALLQGKNTPEEAKEWKERLETLLGLKAALHDLHDSVYGNCDDDDEPCDHDH